MSILVDLVKEDYGLHGSGRWWRSDVHSSLVVDSERDLYFFNARDLKGDAVDYLIKVRGLTRRNAEEYTRKYAGALPKEVIETSLQIRFEKLVGLFHSSGREDRSYWYNRKLNDSTIDRYRLGFFEGWNLIPIFDDGLFINFQCRRDNPDKKIRFWYKDTDFKPVLYNKDILKFVETVYIVEGMVDCILLNQLGFPSVCSTNGADTWNPGWIKYFTKMKNIFYTADNDKAGVVGANMVCNSLGSKVRVLRFKDKCEKYGALDFFREGGTVDQFKQILETNSVYSFEKENI